VILDPSEDAVMIGEVADRFLQDRVAASPTGRLAPNDPAIWAAMAEMGWLALALPEARGGMDASPELLAVIAEALGRAGVCQPFVANLGLAQQALLLSEDEAAAGIAAAIADGSRKAALVRSAGVSAGEDGRLDGAALLVPGGAGADVVLVVADRAGTPALFAIDASAAGVVRVPVETVDGTDMADLTFLQAEAGHALLAGADVLEKLAWIDDLASVLHCAEGLGAMDALLRATTEHVAMRQQFGKPLRSFQVIDHALADMRVAVAEVRALIRAAIARLAGAPDQRQRSVSAAAANVARLGREVSHRAIQFHGAMGVTEELTVGLLAKRLLGIACLLGTDACALDRYAALLVDGACWSYLGQGGPDVAGDLGLDKNGLGFRAEVAAWLDAARDCGSAAAHDYGLCGGGGRAAMAPHPPRPGLVRAQLAGRVRRHRLERGAALYLGARKRRALHARHLTAGPAPGRPGAVPLWHPPAAGALSAADRFGGRAVVPGIFGTRRRIRPCRAGDAGRARWR
jgi:alkylation response protein AidB-like acyl-CoA dehydrogenase